MPQDYFSSQNTSNVSPAAGGTLTPDPSQNQVYNVTMPAGNITVANPATAAVGEVLIFHFLQDGTGGRTVTFGANYKVNWTPTTTAGLRNVISFECLDGTLWVQTATAIGLPN